MGQEGRQPEGLAPRGPFDHPKLKDLVHKEVDIPPGWDEDEPDRGRPYAADGVEELPPRSAEDIPREPLAERATKRRKEY